MLQQYCTAQLQQAIDNIVMTTAPEKIFLLGATVAQHNTYSIFNPSLSPATSVQHYFLLVLLSHTGKQSKDEVQLLAEQSCATSTPVTIFVQPVHVFNEWLLAGHPFACVIATEATRVYDADTVPLESCAQSPMSLLHKDFLQWYNRSKEFMTGAELFITRKQYTLATFLLQQATEFTCTGLVQMFTGFRAGTHNIDKLLRYTQLFCHNLARIFPRNTEKEQRLYQLLQDAYINGRYKYDFVVSGKEMSLLTERVQLLMREAYEIAKAHAS